MVLLEALGGHVSVDGGRPRGPAAQLALLGHAAEEVAVGGVGEPGCVGGVGGVSGAEARVVHGHDDGPVLLGHGRHRVRIVRVRQVFLGVEVRREDEGLAVPARRAHEAAPAVADGELVAATTSSAQVKRRARQAEACLRTASLSWASLPFPCLIISHPLALGFNPASFNPVFSRVYGSTMPTAILHLFFLLLPYQSQISKDLRKDQNYSLSLSNVRYHPFELLFKLLSSRQEYFRNCFVNYVRLEYC
jgi:hypothetical protein